MGFGMLMTDVLALMALVLLAWLTIGGTVLAGLCFLSGRQRLRQREWASRWVGTLWLAGGLLCLLPLCGDITLVFRRLY